MPDKKSKLEVSLEELLEAGCHMGHRSDRWNPKAAPFLYGVKEGVHIFDLVKTREALLAATQELKQRAQAGESILLLGTKQQAQETIKKTAESLGIPYITNHWIGGLFTNFDQIKRSIDKLAQMKKEREAGDYRQFTKREQLIIDREIARFERILGGIANLTALPDMLIVVDINKERTAVEEARKMGVALLGIVDSNSDPTSVDFPIPANDDSVKSVEYIVGKLGEAIELGQKSQKSEARNPKHETAEVVGVMLEAGQ